MNGGTIGRSGSSVGGRRVGGSTGAVGSGGVWPGSRMVGSRGVRGSWGTVGARSVLGSRGMVAGRLGVFGVADISHVARVGIVNVVLHSLDTAVRKGNVILALGGIPVTGLHLAKVGAGVVVLNGILIVVLGWLFLIGGAMAIGGGGAVGWTGMRARLVVGGAGGVVGDTEAQEGRKGNENLRTVKRINLRRPWLYVRI